MKKSIITGIAALAWLGCAAQQLPDHVTLTPDRLQDKIRGGWAGQTIGVVFGAPTEFKFAAGIADYQPLGWSAHYIKYWWDKKPGLFDDIYNDLTFVESFQQEGVDCSQAKLAERFAAPEYHLAHANQAARYNIRNGIMPPQSGYWMNNPHADDIDFEIESDFIGVMSPAMLPQAMEIASRVGHIMNSGDGFYGGAYVAGMYSAAFIYDNPAQIVDAALAAIPPQSKYYQCIDDVRKWHAQYPDDWRQCWFELQKKWTGDVGCPKGVFLDFDIDAKLNSAYVTLALLYGKGDFAATLDIAARCGQDSDCGPSTAGGVLGAMLGYSKIPAFWLDPLKEIENLNFAGTDISLAKGAAYSLEQAKQLIAKNGGSLSDTRIVIPVRKPDLLPLEQNFTDTYPLFRESKDEWMSGDYTFDFEGNGFIIWGNLVKTVSVTATYAASVSTRHIGSEVFGLAEPHDPYVAQIEVWIDGRKDCSVRMPMKNTERRLEPAWKYCMPEGKHTVTLKWLNPEKNYLIRINDIIYYSDKPNAGKLYDFKR